ncbi:MAG: twin transmembrane helix small protein [Burkholderiales bacterium]|nr:twin transmembrane helix small protein [Burkholderiales bacterium]
MSYLVALAFAAILGSLAIALVFMMRGGKNGTEKSKRMARALALRVGFSVLLFICILVAWKMGIIQPTGIPQGK